MSWTWCKRQPPIPSPAPPLNSSPLLRSSADEIPEFLEPPLGEYFANRTGYAWVVLVGQSPRDATLQAVRDMIFTFEFSAVLKNPPLVLDGGFPTFASHYPTFCVSAEVVDEGSDMEVLDGDGADLYGADDDADFESIFGARVTARPPSSTPKSGLLVDIDEPKAVPQLPAAGSTLAPPAKTIVKQPESFAQTDEVQQLSIDDIMKLTQAAQTPISQGMPNSSNVNRSVHELVMMFAPLDCCDSHLSPLLQLLKVHSGQSKKTTPSKTAFDDPYYFFGARGNRSTFPQGTPQSVPQPKPRQPPLTTPLAAVTPAPILSTPSVPSIPPSVVPAIPPPRPTPSLPKPPVVPPSIGRSSPSSSSLETSTSSSVCAVVIPPPGQFSNSDFYFFSLPSTL